MKVKPKYANAEEATIGMINDPCSWPRWPVLPLKNRRVEFGDDRHEGYLSDENQNGINKPPYKVRQGNIFFIQTTDPIIAEFNSVAELLAAGWIVD